LRSYNIVHYWKILPRFFSKLL